MRDDSGNRPGCGGMFRWERSPALEETTAAVALIRTLASERILQGLDRYQTVQCGLAGQKPGFPPMFVVRWKAQQIESSPCSYKACDPYVGDRFVMADCRGILWE